MNFPGNNWNYAEGTQAKIAIYNEDLQSFAESALYFGISSLVMNSEIKLIMNFRSYRIAILQLICSYSIIFLVISETRKLYFYII